MLSSVLNLYEKYSKVDILIGFMWHFFMINKTKWQQQTVKVNFNS